MSQRRPKLDQLGQHMQIRDLFTEVETSTGKARRDAFERLVRLLAMHETAEEQLIHLLVRAGAHGGNDIVADRLAEEHKAKELLARLEEVGPARCGPRVSLFDRTKNMVRKVMSANR